MLEWAFFLMVLVLLEPCQRKWGTRDFSKGPKWRQSATLDALRDCVNAEQGRQNRGAAGPKEQILIPFRAF
jgi:hypothetical protein